MALDGLSTRAFNMKNLISFFSNLEDKMDVQNGKFIYSQCIHLNKTSFILKGWEIELLK